MTSYRAEPFTERWADYALGTSFADLPGEVVDMSKRVTLDTLGCMVLGSSMAPGRSIASYVGSIGATGQATVIGAGLKTSTALAALANGTSGHADELDAVHITRGHFPVVGVSMGLALCESLGGSGADYINALNLAYDIGSRFVKAVGGREALMYQAHMHTSSPYAVAVALAAARMMGLDQLQTRYGMALAAHNISSPMAFMDERAHMSKAMTNGQAAFAGITGASLAAHGFEANDRIVEAEHGLLDAWVNDATDLAGLNDGLGQTYSVNDTGFKYYSAGYPIQAPLWSALRIMTAHGVTPDDIASVRVGLATRNANVVDSRAMPSISIQSMLSLGMVLGQLEYEDAHNDEALARPDVVRLREATELVRDDEMDAELARLDSAWIEITTTDGRVLTEGEQVPPGHWDRGGMPWDDVIAKFRSLVEPRLGTPAANGIVDIVRSLEERESLTELGELLAGPSAITT